MSYYSDYYIHVYIPIELNAYESHKDFIKTLKAFKYEFLDHQYVDIDRFKIIKVQAKWYDFIDDMIEISKSYPLYEIEILREGEERDDNEKTRIKNGKSETVKGEIVFPEFKELTFRCG